MNSFATILIGLVFTLTVTGCACLQSLPDAQPRWKVASEEPVQILLETTLSFNYFQRLTDVELERKFLLIKKRFAASADEADRWRLIFLSILPGKSFSNREYALNLLHERVPEGVPDKGSRVALADMLRMLLEDQRELELKWTAEKERADKLARQLDELKEIEKILSERDTKRPAGE